MKALQAAASKDCYPAFGRQTIGKADIRRWSRREDTCIAWKLVQWSLAARHSGNSRLLPLGTLILARLLLLSLL